MYRVLIVDDEKAVRQGLSKLILWEEYGFTVAGSAASGRQALERIHTAPFDLVLTDVRMPGIDGIQLIEALRQEHFPGEIIILSAFPEFEYARRAIESGVSHYLLKPINDHLLVKALERVRGVLASRGPAPAPPAPSAACEPPSVDPPPLASPDLMKAVLRYIDEHYNRDISLTAIADVFYMNAVYLGRLFKASTGQRFTDYLNTLRIERASELLRLPDLWIYEISENVGYHDLNYFYRMFKAKTGMTPTEYRATHLT